MKSDYSRIFSMTGFYKIEGHDLPPPRPGSATELYATNVLPMKIPIYIESKFLPVDRCSYFTCFLPAKIKLASKSIIVKQVKQANDNDFFF